MFKMNGTFTTDFVVYSIKHCKCPCYISSLLAVMISLYIMIDLNLEMQIQAQPEGLVKT